MVEESIQRTLGRMEGKLDSVMADQSVEKENRKDIYVRLDRLEKWQSRITGAVAVVTLLLGLVWKYLTMKTS